MTDRALRVAVIGSGPSGFYAVEALQKDGRPVEVDMFDRLPTPYGLVRGGVAPDHPKIKSVVRVYEKMASHPSFRFLGNVQIGRDLSHEELLGQYDAVIYAVGAQTDRALGVPGEDLPGSHAATDFVGWYNGHPDYRDRTFDLSQERVAIVGVGNVAMDVARILASTPEELGTTDIADHALEALRGSRVREIVLLGRRGPVQAAFTHPELKEFGELHAADVVVDPSEVALDPASAAALEAAEQHDVRKNVELLRAYAARPLAGKPRRVTFRFLVSPLELYGAGRVEGVVLGRNRLTGSGEQMKAEPTGETERLAAGLVFRSVGYKGVALPGVPFDERGGVIPNVDGRVVTARGSTTTVPGVYVAGWIKRGPSGVIGTNKPDSHATAAALLADHAAGTLPRAAGAGRAAIDALLAARGVQVVSFDDWRRIDAAEQERGRAGGRPRVKFTDIGAMLAIARGGAADA